MKYTLFLFAAALLISACSSSTPSGDLSETMTIEASQVADSFGEAPAPDEILTFDQLRAQLAQNDSPDSLVVKVKGTVQEVCQMKGCWMTVASQSESVEPMMVRFKDYGFFVPKDISGREVVMEGIAYLSTMSVEEQRHYAEDAGKSEAEIAAITDPKEEYTFEASGVLLLQ